MDEIWRNESIPISNSRTLTHAQRAACIPLGMNERESVWLRAVIRPPNRIESNRVPLPSNDTRVRVSIERFPQPMSIRSLETHFSCDMPWAPPRKGNKRNGAARATDARYQLSAIKRVPCGSARRFNSVHSTRLNGRELHAPFSKTRESLCSIKWRNSEIRDARSRSPRPVRDSSRSRAI